MQIVAIRISRLFSLIRSGAGQTAASGVAFSIQIPSLYGLLTTLPFIFGNDSGMMASW
jgi:hypothetical protein